MLDLRLVTARRPAAALGTLLLTGIGVVGVYYLFTQHLQRAAGLDPLEAGLWTLPYVAVNILGALLAPGLASRFRPEVVVAVSLVVIVAGAVLTVVVGWAGAPVPALAGSVAVLGLGHGAAAALVSDLVISSAPPEQTGSAAATQEVSAELGTALGIAAAGVLSVVVHRSALRDGAALAEDGGAPAQGSRPTRSSRRCSWVSRRRSCSGSSCARTVAADGPRIRSRPCPALPASRPRAVVAGRVTARSTARCSTRRPRS